MTNGTRRGEGSASRPGRSLPPGKDPLSIVQEAGWAPGPVGTGAEIRATGEAEEIRKTLNNSISETFSDSGRVLIKHNPVVLPTHYPCR
jgi:hypothetical protein